MIDLKHYNHLRCPGHYIDEAFLQWFSHQDLSLYNNRQAAPNQLFRRAVRHQQVSLMNGLGLQKGRFTLDHHPIPFSALKRIFLRQEGINPDQISRQNITVELLREWQRFHGALAEYRVTSTHYNYALNRWYSDYWHDLDRQWALIV